MELANGKIPQLENLRSHFSNLSINWEENSRKIRKSADVTLRTHHKIFLRFRKQHDNIKEELERFRSQVHVEGNAVSDSNLNQELYVMEEFIDEQMTEQMELINFVLDNIVSHHHIAWDIYPEAHSRMSEADKTILTKNLAILCFDLNPIGILACLEMDEIIFLTDIQWIQAPKAVFEQNNRLIKMLKSRSSDALPSFVRALRETKQTALADLLEECRQAANCEQSDTVVSQGFSKAKEHYRQACRRIEIQKTSTVKAESVVIQEENLLTAIETKTYEELVKIAELERIGSLTGLLTIEVVLIVLMIFLFAIPFLSSQRH